MQVSTKKFGFSYPVTKVVTGISGSISQMICHVFHVDLALSSYNMIREEYKVGCYY